MENMKQLELTPMLWCQEKRELTERNEIAREYSRSVRNERVANKLNKMQLVEALILLVIALCLFGRMLF